MSEKRKKFYEKIINKIILDKNSKILVVGGTKYDANIFNKNNFLNVTIGNLDKETDYSPYKHTMQDLRKLTLENDSYDYVVANACIHHTSKPHQAILEMYRVSIKGIIVIEGNDSLFIKITNFLGLSQEYELSAIIDSSYSHDKGGVDNTNVPNFVYRWTEREVFKLISCYQPEFIHKIEFYYDSDFEGYKNVKKMRLISPILFLLEIVARVYFLLFKKEKNLFSFFVNKGSRKLNRWIEKFENNQAKIDKEYIFSKIKSNEK